MKRSIGLDQLLPYPDDNFTADDVLAFVQRAALAEAQEGLDIVMAQLKDAKARLAGVQTRLAELQKGFDDAVAKKQVGGNANSLFTRTG